MLFGNLVLLNLFTGMLLHTFKQFNDEDFKKEQKKNKSILKTLTEKVTDALGKCSKALGLNNDLDEPTTADKDLEKDDSDGFEEEHPMTKLMDAADQEDLRNSKFKDSKSKSLMMLAFSTDLGHYDMYCIV